MTHAKAALLAELQGRDLKNHAVSFWLVKRSTTKSEAHYNVLRVDISEQLASRFRGYFRDQVQIREFHLADYDFRNADGDDVALSMPLFDTDFVKIQDQIEAGFDNARVKEYADLLSSWAYVVALEDGLERIYAWRKISSLTQPKKVRSRTALLFQNQRLTDIDDREVFLIDPHFDFFVYRANLFILNKREFEISMNFRAGMQAQGEEVLKELDTLSFLSKVDPIRSHVGNNLHHLRKLASIRKAGYYKQPEYVRRLIEVSRSEGWDLKIENGKIVVEAATVDLLLKLLNNDRLRSPINNEYFDSAAKQPIDGGEAAG